jgi:CBS domain containing-hemolysin-like protein
MDFFLIALLTLLNGAFAMSELALTASRKVRLTNLAEAGDKGAAAALALLDNPTRFLSSVQVGITSIGMLNAIVGEAAFSAGVAAWLQTAWACRSGPPRSPPPASSSRRSPSSRSCSGNWCPSASGSCIPRRCRA